MKSKTLPASCARGLGLLVVLALLLGSLPLVHARPDRSPPSAPAPESVSAGDSVALPPGVSTDWWSTVQEQIRQSEYHVTWQDQTYLPDIPAAYQAPNRAHNLRTYFAPEGPVVIPRTLPQASPGQVESPGAGWRWGLRLVAWGRQGALQPAAAATLQAEANRIEYRRAGLTEWYVNDERGLEQGFQIAAPPAQDPSGNAPLILELALDTAPSASSEQALTARLTDNGAAVEFITAGGVRVLRYSDLYVADATGHPLPASLSLSPTVIAISVEDAGATYPLTVDPLATTPNWTAEGGQLNAHLGWSVGTAGDVNGDGYDDIIVGAPGYNSVGAVFVYHGSPCGPGTTAAWIEGPPPAIAYDFGRAVATAGDVNGDGYDDVIIGSGCSNPAYSEDHEGAVFVYHGSATGLSSSPNWSAEGNQEGANLGWSVGTAGDVNGDSWDDVIAGAPGYDHGQTDEGAIFVWYGSSSGLGSLGDWAAESNRANTWFGSSVGTAGNVNGDAYDDIIIGAPSYDTGSTDVGAAFVYHGSGAGLGAFADWTYVHTEGHARFGDAVGTAGDVNGDGLDDVIVGAPGDDVSGQVFVFHGSGTGLSTTANWTAGSDLDLIGFGASVGTVGDVTGDGYDDVIIGSHGFNKPFGRGVFVYRGSAVGLGTLSIWSVEDGHSGGAAGDVNGDGYADVIVGQPNYSPGPNFVGRALVYHGGAPPGPAPDWTKESGQADAHFGAAVATAGDVNGDGYDEIIVGAPNYDNGQTNEGLAFVYAGTATGPNPAPYWHAESNQADAFLGSSVSTAGSVNDDDYADVIIGATGYDSAGYSNNGMVLAWYGSSGGLGPDGTPANADWSVAGTDSGIGFGRSVGTAGDVNGDGYSDVILGADEYDGGQNNEGAAFAYLGSATGLNTSLHWTAESNRASAYFGNSVGTAGDVNGDGYADVIVGAPYYNLGAGYEGRAYVYHGSGDGLGTMAAWIVEGDQYDAHVGISVGTAGDVNGDGYADVIVGADAYLLDTDSGGKAFVWHGSATGLGDGGTPATADWTVGCNHVGTSVATAGDVNGDGYADVIVGARNYDYGLSNVGGAFIFQGSGAGLSSEAAWAVVDDQQDTYFGWSMGTAGDVNGDGYSDVIVGASHYDNGQTDEGRAYIWYGSAGGPSAAANWSQDGTQDDAYFGSSVSTAGDVNGDGYADVVVGAYLYDNGQTDEGVTFVYLGSATGLNTGLHWTAESNQDNAYFGHSVGRAGDVNGDGYDDVIIGADYYDNSQADEGAAFVWHGSATGLGLPGYPANADWSAESDQASAYFGRSVGTAGDVNGDGYADVIVGAWKYDNTPADEGAAFVWHGSATGLGASGTPANADWSAESDQADSRFGWSVGTAGDVNGDRYSDVIVGAYQYDRGHTDEGRALVWLGSATGLGDPGTPANADWIKESDKDYAYFGGSVGTAGDVNGDGRADVIIGASNYEHGQEGEGRAFVYAGTVSGLSGPPIWFVESDQPYAHFGNSVGTAGDVNGDGYADIVVGARDYSCGYANEGGAFVYHGSSSGPSTVADWTALGGQEGANFGGSVGTAGDVNGDGYADVIVGAHRYDNGDTDEGRALVYYGNESPGWSLHPRQRRSNDSAPIAHLGQADGNALRLALLGHIPFGRGKVKLEWEVKPLGALFDGIGTQQSATWLDTGTAGVEIGELVSSLVVNYPYHWRVRLRYKPGTTPFQQHSRWLTIPWNGWQEQDLRTAAAAPAAVVGFSSVAYMVNESAGTATITVQLNAASGNTITVNYATSDGTATAGSDYTATSGPLTFDPGVTSRTFTVSILDDTSDEPNETVILTLSGSTNAVIGTSPATLTIVDNEALLHHIYLPVIMFSYQEGQNP